MNSPERTGVPVIWLGDSLDVLREFSSDAKADLGQDLRRLQNGEEPLDSASMAPRLRGVFELRTQDKDFWYRLLYLRIRGALYVLHCLKKKTNQTPHRDIEIAERRLKQLKQETRKGSQDGD